MQNSIVQYSPRGVKKSKLIWTLIAPANRGRGAGPSQLGVRRNRKREKKGRLAATMR